MLKAIGVNLITIQISYNFLFLYPTQRRVRDDAPSLRPADVVVYYLLPDQGYRTPQVAVIDEHQAIIQSARRKPEEI
jgi:hypothetical protein